MSITEEDYGSHGANITHVVSGSQGVLQTILESVTGIT